MNFYNELKNNDFSFWSGLVFVMCLPFFVSGDWFEDFKLYEKYKITIESWKFSFSPCLGISNSNAFYSVVNCLLYILGTPYRYKDGDLYHGIEYRNVFINIVFLYGCFVVCVGAYFFFTHADWISPCVIWAVRALAFTILLLWRIDILYTSDFDFFSSIFKQEGCSFIFAFIIRFAFWFCFPFVLYFVAFFLLSIAIENAEILYSFYNRNNLIDAVSIRWNWLFLILSIAPILVILARQIRNIRIGLFLKIKQAWKCGFFVVHKTFQWIRKILNI